MNNQNTDLSNQGMSIRERGKKFLDELKAKGPTLDKVGKISVRQLSGQSKGMPSSKA